MEAMTPRCPGARKPVDAAVRTSAAARFATDIRHLVGRTRRNGAEARQLVPDRRPPTAARVRPSTRRPRAAATALGAEVCSSYEGEKIARVHLFHRHARRSPIFGLRSGSTVGRRFHADRGVRLDKRRSTAPRRWSSTQCRNATGVQACEDAIVRKSAAGIAPTRRNGTISVDARPCGWDVSHAKVIGAMNSASLPVDV